jgi:hypothetical protein
LKWYRDNRIVGTLVVLIFVITVFLGYKAMKGIGPLMGTEVKKEKNSK